MWISSVCQGVAVAELGLEAAAEAVQVWTLLRLTPRDGFFAYLQNIRSAAAPPTARRLSLVVQWLGGGRGGAGGITAAHIIAAAKTRYLEM